MEVSFFAACPWPRPLAQTWHAMIGFRTTDTSIFTKQDHMPVSSRSLRRRPYEPEARAGWHARAEFYELYNLGITVALQCYSQVALSEA